MSRVEAELYYPPVAEAIVPIQAGPVAWDDPRSLGPC